MTLSCFTWPQTRLGLAKKHQVPTFQRVFLLLRHLAHPTGTFLAYYILPFTFFEFSPLRRVLCWPSASKLSAGKWGRQTWRGEMRMTSWSSGSLPEFRTLEVSPLCQERKPCREQVSLLVTHTPPSIVSLQLTWNWRRRSAKTSSPAHPSSHCKAIRDQGQAAG